MNKQRTFLLGSTIFCCVTVFSASETIAQPADDKASGRTISSLIPAIFLPEVPKASAVSSSKAHKKKYAAKKRVQRKSKAPIPKTHFEKGLYFKQHGDSNRAIVEFLKATQENPRQIRAFYEQALIFRSKGYFKLAESSLEQLLAAKSDDQQARILLATVRIQQGNLSGAVEQLTKSLGIAVLPPENSGGAYPAATQKGIDPASPLSAYVLQSIHNLLKEWVPPAAEPATPVEENKEQLSKNDTAASSIPVQHHRVKWLADYSTKQSRKEKVHNWLAMWVFPEEENKVENEDIASATEVTEEYGVNKNETTNNEIIGPIVDQEDHPSRADTTADTTSDTNNQTTSPVFTNNTKPFPFANSILGMLQNPSPSGHITKSQATADSVEKPKQVENTHAVPEDSWTVRLRYLAEHGTSSLKEGEAFMFSEDTGEASLFLAGGEVIRRNVATPRDPQEVVLLRRPDILKAEELMYNLSLLGKLMPKQAETPQNRPSAAVEQTHIFDKSSSMDKPQSLWSWTDGLKHLFKLQ